MTNFIQGVSASAVTKMFDENAQHPPPGSIFSQFRLPGVYLSWANSLFLSFFAFNGIIHSLRFESGLLPGARAPEVAE